MKISSRRDFIRANNPTLNYMDGKHSTAVTFFSDIQLNEHFNQYDTE
jgi:hypothetical protein